MEGKNRMEQGNVLDGLHEECGVFGIYDFDGGNVASSVYYGLEMILHTDQGSVYASKDFNELLPLYNIVHSMSRAGTPTDNAAMEAINGWIKTEMFTDLHITSNENIENEIKEYITFFNEERPAYSLNYLTPKQYKEYYAQF